MARYEVLIKPRAEKQIEALGTEALRRKIVEKIEALADDPRPPGCLKMKGTLTGYRIRHGDYRILYEIEDRVLRVLVVRVAHRGEAYD